MKHLFSDWNKISSKIQKSPRVFLFLDYDGTLTPIVSRPGLARIPDKVKKTLTKIKNNPRFRVSIISGRSLKDIKKMVGLKGIIYAGNHGLEIEGRGFRASRRIAVRSVRPIIKEITLSLRRTLKGIKGVIIEDKGITLSLHYRLAGDKSLVLIRKKFYGVVMPYVYSKKVKIYPGKKVLEVRPDLGWDKGRAVKWLLKGEKRALALYLGDDVTDLDAFRAIKGKGISIFVGMPRKYICADYFLRDSKEVEIFIDRLA